MNTLEKRERRQRRARHYLRGTPDRPRLCVVATSRHIYAQIIDDTKGVTLLAASTMSKEAASAAKGVKKLEAARIVGEMLAQKAQAKKVVSVLFDRGHRLYHGRVRALAEAARAGGLKF